MTDTRNVLYWCSREIEIIKTYPLFGKYKVRILTTVKTHIVDKYAVKNKMENAISIAWLEKNNA